MGIERTDIDGVLELNLEWQSYDILIYDNVPGGAGHVKRLLSRDAIINSLRAGLNKVSKPCCDENTSCYNCLRNYYNQSHHSKLQRKLALDIIKRLLFAIEGVTETFQNEGWHWDSKVTSSKKRMRLILGTDGRNPGNESAEEIWNDLLDDCYDENEITQITELKKNSPDYISQPYYNKTIKIEETGEEFVANLVWDTKQVILFLNDSYDDYSLAKKTGWDVYCTSDGFDVKELLEKVGE